MDVPEPVRRYESYTHEQMAAEVASGNDPAGAGEAAARWAGLGAQLRDSMRLLGAMSARSEEAWRGPAGDAVRETLAKASGWSRQATEMSYALSGAVSEQAGIAARARDDMPPPVPYDPAAMIRDAAGSLAGLLALPDAMASRRAESESARAKAIDVLNARDAALRSSVPGGEFGKPDLGQP